ncbi:MAG: 4Fe-4S binding protein [Anaerolineae bacterium]|nr:4Fe-4S binding protein [Anaerolineae bacterium]
MLTGAVGHNIFLEVDPAICHACRQCRAKTACRRKAIRTIDRGEPPFLDTSLCWQCLSCTRACPFGAVVRHDSERDHH